MPASRQVDRQEARWNVARFLRDAGNCANVPMCKRVRRVWATGLLLLWV
jgi:hypothetical protein